MSPFSFRRAIPRTLCLALIAMLVLGLAPTPPPAQADDTIAVVPATPGASTAAVLIELRATPISEVYADALAAARGTNQPADAARRAAQAQLHIIGQQQQSLAALLARAPFGATEIY